MKRTIFFTAALFAAVSVFADPKDDVTSAAKKLGAAASYTWHTTVELGGDSQFKPDPTDGKMEKDGYTHITFSFGDNTSEAVMKGTNGAIKADGDWQSVADALKDDGGGGFNPTMFLARRIQNFKTPADDAAELVGGAKSLTLADGVYSGDMTEDAAKDHMRFGRRRGGDNGGGPEITNAKGSMKFWVTDGALTKYQFNVQGHIDFNGNARDIDSTTTTEFSDVGKTKVEVPDDAKKKLQ